MDKVFIEGLLVKTIVGVLDWERVTPRLVRFDLELGWDIRPAATSDALEDALDYAAVSERITNFVENSRFQLIETMAEEVAKIVQQEFGVSWLRLRLTKPGAVPTAEGVGIIIERGGQM